MDAILQDEPKSTHARWRFFRDVVVFELKMFIGNLRDFALMPVSVVAALIDLISKGDREGSLFYRVLRWGAHSEQMLDAYSPIRHELQYLNVNPNYTVDAVVARLESVVVREIEKGGTAATIKAALDRTIDQLHHETSQPRERAQAAMAKAIEGGKRVSRIVTGKNAAQASLTAATSPRDLVARPQLFRLRKFPERSHLPLGSDADNHR